MERSRVGKGALFARRAHRGSAVVGTRSLSSGPPTGSGLWPARWQAPAGPGGFAHPTSPPYDYTAVASAPASDTLLLLVGVGGVWPLFLEADIELLFDFRQLILLGLEIPRVRPLEFGLQHAIDLPINVAKVIVDGRIDRLEFDRALEVLHRLLVIAKPVVGPAERIDDVAVIGPLVDRALDHTHALIEMDALIDPGITQIIEHVRLVRKQFERLLEVELRLRPLLGALEADAAEIVGRPVRLGRLCNQANRLSVAFGAALVLLALALDVGERSDCLQIVRPVHYQFLDVLLGLLGTLQGVEVDGELDFNVALEGRGGRDAFIDLDRQLGLFHQLVELSKRL